MDVAKEDIVEARLEKRRKALCAILRSQRELTADEREDIAIELEETYVYVRGRD